MHYSDLTDFPSLINVIKRVKPNEIYNLAAQSHVQVSFETPEYTANADAIGTLRILEAIRSLGMEKKLNFIKHQPQRCMDLFHLLKMKKRQCIQQVLMVQLNYMLIG